MTAPPGIRASRLTWLFAGTLALSAALVFAVQPLLGRLILPYYGGVSTVWNTLMLFFQAVLLLGYLNAHLAVRYLSGRGQLAWQLLLFMVAGLALPVALPGHWSPAADLPPAASLLLVLAKTVGLPFLALASTAPLLQAWYAGRDEKHDPYFLYAASNIGSLVGLISYPLLAEPQLGLGMQGVVWSYLYAGLACAVLACGRFLVQGPRIILSSHRIEAAGPPVAWSRRALWVALAFVPSTLLLAVTQHISTDIASMPLLWIVPLLIYLLTFVVAFMRQRPVSTAFLARLVPYVVLGYFVLEGLAAPNLWPNLIFHLPLLAILALYCHSELYDLRPVAGRLTEFYLCLSLGGVLGGVFNALLAPAIFSDITEYPLAIGFATCLWALRQTGVKPRYREIAAAVGLFVVIHFGQQELAGMILVAMLGLRLGVAAVTLALLRRPTGMALAVIALLAGNDVNLGRQTEVARFRSFFGVHRLEFDPASKVISMIHGSTIHGAQSTEPARSRWPLAYYSRSGPAGQVFAALDDSLHRIGVIGLGSGALSCYAHDGQEWVFFEIDPAIVETARNSKYFTYLRDCQPSARIELGDGRLKLAAEQDASFDLIVIDAFSSDSVPLHLLTREAMQVYLAKLRPHGKLLFHLSNRNLDLANVLAGLAEDADLIAKLQFYRASESEVAQHISNSNWMILGRRSEGLGEFAKDPAWKDQGAKPGARLWTDDYANVLSAIIWQ